jgi:hypothetical protein
LWERKDEYGEKQESELRTSDINSGRRDTDLLENINH